MEILERMTAWGAPSPPQVSPSFLTLTSPLALGFQILLISLGAFAGHPDYALWVLLIPMNLYWLFVVIYRRYLVLQNIARGKMVSVE